MKLLRIGNQIVNLDMVTDISWVPAESRLIFFFAFVNGPGVRDEGCWASVEFIGSDTKAVWLKLCGAVEFGGLNC